MRQYETLFVLHPELGEVQVRAAIERAKRIIEDRGGKLDQVRDWGLRELAYPIEKLTRGYYVVLEYTAGTDTVPELERTLRIADEVLRYVSVRASEVKPAEPRARKRPARPRDDEAADSAPAQE